MLPEHQAGTADPTPPLQDDHDGDYGKVPGEQVPAVDEFDMRRDKDAMDAAIADFFEAVGGLAAGAGLQSALSRLPVPGRVEPKALSVHAMMDAGMLQRMDNEEALRSIPAEVLLLSTCSGPLVCLIIHCLSMVYT